MTNIVTPLMFKTPNSYYVYDDATRIVLPLNPREKRYLESDFFHDGPDDTNAECSTLIEKIKKYNMFIRRPPQYEVNKEKIMSLIANEGISSLVLTVTDDCNFRCKYCFFSSHYNFTNEYSNSKMSWETAKSAVDYYYRININAEESNPNVKYNVTFYGGEPLLNWQLIKKVVDYCESQYSNQYQRTIFGATVNGSLLDEEKINYMITHRFALAISFDGNEYEHDRNRVDINSRPTFSLVMKKLALLEKLQISYGDSNAAVFSYALLLTYDNRTDLLELNKFFKNNRWLDKHVTRINRVSDTNTDYYDNQQDNSTKERFFERQEKLFELYRETEPNKRTKFMTTFFAQMLSPVSLLTNFTPNDLRGACTPGQSKIHVDPKGNMHTCEKINRLYPLGDITSGMDINKQTMIMKNFLEEISNNCANCNVTGLCTMCYANMQNDGTKFHINSDKCDRIKQYITDILTKYYILAENNNFA